jgi:hypothetical protein
LTIAKTMKEIAVKNSHFIKALSLAIIVALLTACVPAATNNGGQGMGAGPTEQASTAGEAPPETGQGTPTGQEPEEGTIFIAPDPSQSPQPILMPDAGVPATVQPGQVTVEMSATSYAEGEAIQGTVANGLEDTIYTEDMKSDCSIVILEQQAGEAWQPIPGCAMERAPLILALDPGHGRVVTLDPLSIHFKDGSASQAPAFEAGTYRIRFTYRLEPGPEGEEPLEAFSDTFTIQ